VIPYDALSDLVEREIWTRISKVATHIADGGAADWAEYRYQVGVRKGLKDALVALDEAKAKINIEES
jgi:hypothetical protein